MRAVSALPGQPQASHIPLPPRGELDWLANARCEGMDPELFFPRKSDAQKEIIKFCLGCPVRLDCLQYALDAGAEHGVWGGTTQDERKKLRRKRQAA